MAKAKKGASSKSAGKAASKSVGKGAKPSKAKPTKAPAKKKPVAKAAAKSAAKGSAAKGKSAQKSAPKSYDVSKGRAALRTIVDAWGAGDARDNAAFASLVSASRKSQLGRKTKAVDVFAGAVHYAETIHQAFSAQREVVEEHYSLARFRYFLGEATLLGAQITKDQNKRGSFNGNHASVVTLETALRAARKRLASKLRAVLAETGSHYAGYKTALAEGGADADALAQSTLKLAAVAKAVLASKDQHLVRLIAAEGLNDSLVSEAKNAAEDLAEAGGAAGSALASDSPATNLREGSAICELREAFRRFAEGHEDTDLIPALAVPHGLDSVMAGLHAEGDGAEAQPAAAASAAVPFNFPSEPDQPPADTHDENAPVVHHHDHSNSN